MAREQARARAGERNASERGDRHWFTRPVASGGYEVVAVSAPGARDRGPLQGTVLSRSEPTEPPDPRPSIFRAIPPYGG